ENDYTGCGHDYTGCGHDYTGCGHDYTGCGHGWGQAMRLRWARPAATAPATAPAPSTEGTPILAALRPVRKSRISQPRARAISRSPESGLTATAVPTTDSIGTSFCESE